MRQPSRRFRAELARQHRPTLLAFPNLMTLADYVYADLCSHLSAEGAPPCRLTYSALSQHYEVSLTPVRAAAKRLVDEGYLTLLEDGRLQIGGKKPRGGKNKALPVERRPVSRDKEIRDALIRRSLQGDQSYVREEALAARFNLGRTALRPILGRLTGAGILEYVPRCGWRVKPLSTSDLCSFLEIRELLEVRALESAYARLEPAVLERLLADNRAGRLGETGNLENNLHGYWIKLSGNRYIIEILVQHAVYYRAMLDYAAPAGQVVDEMAAQHCEILEALLEKNKKQAKRALVKHIRAQKPIVKRVMEELRDESRSANGQASAL